MNVEERLEEQAKENIALKPKVQVLETAIQLVEEKKIQEKNIASLDKKYQNEIVSEAEDEIMVAIHQMKVQLPLENWYDLLEFVPRSQLGNAVSEIGDYEFAYIIQSFLHGFGKIKLGKMRIIPPRPTLSTDQPLVHMPDWPMLRNIKEFFARIIQFFLHGFGKIKLGKMSIIPPRPNVSYNQPMVRVRPNAATNMPDWPMPGNIKNFKQIDLNYVDASVLHLLGKFQENSLLTNVNMYFDCIRTLDEDIPPQVLTKIAPFITSIDSIDSLGFHLYAMVYNNNNTNLGNNHESQLLLKEMMAKARILVTTWYDNEDSFDLWEDKMDWFCSWLYTPRNDEKPRMLHLYGFIYDSEGASFIERIKKDFNKADHAVSFFIHDQIYQNDNLKGISFDNDKTNEKLVIKKVKIDDDCEQLWISRYPLKAAKDWIEANEKEVAEWDRGKLDRQIIWKKKLDRRLSWGMI